MQETPRTCDKNSVCVASDDGPPECQCQGEDKGKGRPDMPNGCTGNLASGSSRVRGGVGG